MTPEQKKKLAEAGKILQKAFPEYFGNIRFNLKPGRNYVNTKLEQDACIEFDGTMVNNISKRFESERKPNR